MGYNVGLDHRNPRQHVLVTRIAKFQKYNSLKTKGKNNPAGFLRKFKKAILRMFDSKIL